MSTTDPLIGARLGDYEIRSLLGRGGMARVYKGYDANLDRYAAVKVIESHLLVSDERDEYYQRFQREARSIARLQHPNIVGVYQFGGLDDNYYMAMVFIEGQDLRAILKQHLRQGTMMSNALILKIIRAMTSALDYAHEHEVIHRDVKPSNILVMSDGRAVLTDFGLALSLPEGTIGNTFGSAHYIAPEQAVSSAQAVAQSDLYALGVCLYEMLTGRVPFDDTSAMSVALKHLSDPPPPPSQLNPNISSEVEAVVMKILSKEVEDRYQTGEEFFRALERAFSLSDDEETHDLDVRSDAAASDAASAATSTSEQPTASVAMSSVTPATGSRASAHPDTVMGRSQLYKTSAKLERISREEARESRQFLVISLVGLLALLAILATFFLSSNANTEDTEPTVAVVVAEDTVTPTETSTPTDEPTAAATPTDAPPTETPAPTATPTLAIPAVLPDAVTEITLHYDENMLVLHNSSRNIVDVSDIVFRYESDVQTTRFAASTWNTGNKPPSALPVDDCFQVWTTTFTRLQKPDYCAWRQAWRAVPRAFWASPEDSDVPRSFDVLYEGEPIATCAHTDNTCTIYVPIRDN